MQVWRWFWEAVHGYGLKMTAVHQIYWDTHDFVRYNRRLGIYIWDKGLDMLSHSWLDIIF
jgi:hypothetical protein